MNIIEILSPYFYARIVFVHSQFMDRLHVFSSEVYLNVLDINVKGSIE